MKKLLLVTTVLAGGMAISQAGLNISIGIGLPLPLPAVVIRQPAVIYAAPVQVIPRVIYPPRVFATCPPAVHYQPRYEDRHESLGHGHGDWRRDERRLGRRH